MVVLEPAQQGPCRGLTPGTDVPSPETEDFVPEGTARLLPKWELRDRAGDGEQSRGGGGRTALAATPHGTRLGVGTPRRAEGAGRQDAWDRPQHDGPGLSRATVLSEALSGASPVSCRYGLLKT